MNPVTDHDSELPLSAEEELVAYLDGELDDDAVRRVEARLAEDAQYRAELTRLQRAWDCLDELPDTSVDPSFTRSTIEMVTLVAKEELTQAQAVLPKLKRKQQFRSAAILAGALAFGFVMTTLLWPSPQQQLARNLPAIENLDLYLPIDDLAFLRALSEEVTFPSHSPAAAESSSEQTEPSQETRLKVTSVTEINQLSDTEKSELAVNQQRFSRLKESEQARLRDLAAEVENSADREKLQKTLIQYHRWLTELSPGAQADLAGLPTDERASEIKKLIDQEQQRRQREISTADGELVLEFLGRYLADHRERLMAEYSESKRKEIDQWLENADDRQRGGILLMLFLQRRRGSDRPGQLFPIRDEELQNLISKLSPSAQQQWNSLSTTSEKQRLLQSWAGTAVRQRMIQRASQRDAREITQEELEDYFSKEISTDQRARLLAMPADEMDRELRRMILDGDKQGRGRYGFGYPPFGGPERGPHGKGPPRRDGERRDGERHEGPPPKFGPPPEDGPPDFDRGHKRPPPREFEGRFPRPGEEGPRRPRRGDFDPAQPPPRSEAQ